MLQISNWIKQASHWLRLHVRHTVAVAFLLAIVFCVFWSFWAAWTEIGGPDIAISLRSLTLGSLQTSVMLDTFDPDNLTVTAHISTTLREPALEFDPSVAEQIPELKNLPTMASRAEYSVYYTGLNVSDLAPTFSYLGTRLIDQNTQRPKAIAYSDFCVLKKSLGEKPPTDTTMVLTMIGDPRKFPFDQYLILYRGESGAYLEYKSKVAYIDSAFTIAPRFPGLVVRDFSGPARDYDGILGRQFDQQAAGKGLRNSMPYNPEFWQRTGFAISVERPLYLRLLTVVLGLVAVLSVIVVSIRSEPSAYLVNAVGIFLALWGVRSIITSSAPKTPNVIDFGVLALFVILMVIGSVKFLLRNKRTTKAPELS